MLRSLEITLLGLFVILATGCRSGVVDYSPDVESEESVGDGDEQGLAVAPFQQDNGLAGIVSMEAESFHQNSGTVGNHAWSKIPDAEASGGFALVVSPDNGALVNTGYSTNSPRLTFDVSFVKTGNHYVWVRGRAQPGAPGASDSCHVGLDGIETASADRITGFGTSWSWSKQTMDASPATLAVASEDLHKINVWMREDGLVVDKIVLTTDPAFVPQGTSIPESPQPTTVVSLTLVNADTGEDIGPLTNDSALNLAALPEHLNVRANTSPATVGSVAFSYDGNPSFSLENYAPYQMAGDPGVDYATWAPKQGDHVIIATPYAGKGKTGAQGNELQIAFKARSGACATATAFGFDSSQESMNGDTDTLSISGNEIAFDIELDGLPSYPMWFYASYTPEYADTYHFTVKKLSQYPSAIKPVYSLDCEIWHQISNPTYGKTGTNDYWLSFSIAIPAGATAYFATHEPYTIADLSAFGMAIQTSPYVGISSIGKSVEGRDITMITLSRTPGPSPTKYFFMSSSHAAYESMGARSVEGMIEWLLLHPSYLDNRIFYFVPIHNPDGVYKGNSRVNANGKDLNRDWRDLTQPETKHVMSFLENNCCFSRLVDLHSWQSPTVSFSAPMIPANAEYNQVYSNLSTYLTMTWYVTNPGWTTFKYEPYDSGYGNSMQIEHGTAYNSSLTAPYINNEIKDEGVRILKGIVGI